MADDKKDETKVGGLTFEDWLKSVGELIKIKAPEYYTTNTPTVSTSTKGTILGEPVFAPKYYGVSVTDTKPKTPVKSLKEMYELDSSSKPKKVKATMTAVEKVKAAAKTLNQLTPSLNKQIGDFYTAPNPFYEMLKKTKPVSFNVPQIQQNIEYKPLLTASQEAEVTQDKVKEYLSAKLAQALSETSPTELKYTENPLKCNKKPQKG